MQVIDPEIVDDGETQIFEGCNSQDIRVEDATSHYGNTSREYHLKRVTVEGLFIYFFSVTFCHAYV